MRDMQENVIEFIRGDEIATVTFSQGRFVSKIRQLAEKYPDRVTILSENEDGSIMAHIPVSAIHLNIIERQLSEEQRDAARERLAAAREAKERDLKKSKAEEP